MGKYYERGTDKIDDRVALDQIIEKNWDQLHPTQKQVIWCFYLGGQKPQEIIRELGLQRDNYYYHIKMGIKRLREG